VADAWLFVQRRVFQNLCEQERSCSAWGEWWRFWSSVQREQELGHLSWSPDKLQTLPLVLRCTLQEVQCTVIGILKVAVCPLYVQGRMRGEVQKTAADHPEASGTIYTNYRRHCGLQRESART
jgi:hypothetical protein